MAATSLEQQLRNLKTPQTSVLHDSKKRDSILFSAKEAAEKDRETIYEIGLSGLNELMVLNPVLSKFESTLFDPTTKNVQRSVETSEFNTALNQNIRKFIIQLSPYLMLDAAHKCLEWLIRRFSINRYDRDEFLMLILPYHETQIFVRCLQTVSFTESKDKWNWLQQAQKSASPLSKQTLFNYTERNPKFMELYGKFTLDAVRDWENRAHYLKTLVGFYCTTSLGALENVAAIKETHITALLESLVKGMVCNSVDMVSSTYMIIAHLVSKIELSVKLLNVLVGKVASLNSQLLTVEAGLLLILIYEVRGKHLRPMSDKVLAQLEAAKWLPQTLVALKSEGTNIVQFYVALFEAALVKLQRTNDPIEGEKYRSLCETLGNLVNFEDPEAEILIEVALNAFIYKEKSGGARGNVITINSDDEDDEMNGKFTLTQWYSSFLKSLERQYPEAFDKIVKQVMSTDQPRHAQLSEGKRSALKTVLNFLLKVSHTFNDTNMFENLYHYNENQRASAVKYLIENLEKIQVTDGGNDLIKDSLVERLIDDSPVVVMEVLSVKPAIMVKTLDLDVYFEKLVTVLDKCLENTDRWQEVLPKVVAAITNKACAKVDEAKVLVAITPLLFPTSEDNTEMVEKILQSAFAKRSRFLEAIKTAQKGAPTFSSISKSVKAALKQQDLLPQFSAMLAAQPASNVGFSKLYFSTFLLAHSLTSTSDVETYQQVLNTVTAKFEKQIANDSNATLQFLEAIVGRYDVLPIDILVLLCQKIADCLTVNDSPLDLVRQSPATSLKLKIFETLLTKYYEASQKNSETAFYGTALKSFLDRCHRTFDEKVEFFSHFYLGQAIKSGSPSTSTGQQVTITPEFQVRVMKLLNTVLSKHDNFTVSNLVIMRLLCAINTESAVIRALAIETLELVTIKNASTTLASYQFVVQNLIKRKDELLLDAEQLPLILYMVIAPDKLVQKSYTNQEKKHCLFVLDDILNVCVSQSSNGQPDYLVAKLLEITRFINNVDLFEKVVVCVSNTYEKVKNTPADQPLSPYESAILKFTLQRIDKQTVKAVARSDSVWSVVLETLRCQKFFLSDYKLCTPAILLMQALDDEIFKSLPIARQVKLLEVLIDTATEANNSQTISVATKLIRTRIELSADAIAKELNKMLVSDEPATTGKLRLKTVSSASVLSTPAWKRGITILEMVQNKENITKPHSLIEPLFNILNKCLSLEDQSPVEYTKQLVLATILQCCQHSPIAGTNRAQVLPDNVFKSDLVVQCIRATENPQTHHHALALLAYTAALIPDQVLHNLVEIFTFMGSSVVRQDDAYSFQIISQVIENVIPIIVKTSAGVDKMAQQQEEEAQQKAVIPILKVFAGILLDVPEHRRNVLYKKLLSTLGATEYMWILLGVVIESNVMSTEKEKSKALRPQGNRRQEAENESELPRKMELMLSIVMQFEPSIVLATCIKIIQYVSQLPEEIVDNNRGLAANVDITDTCIFSVDTHNHRELRFFKYTVVQFVKCVLHSTHFINKIASLDDDAMAEMKLCYQSMIIKILMYIKSVTKSEERYAATSRAKYWKIMLHHGYEILEGTLSLLTPDSMLVVVLGLINHKYSMVRKKVIELFNRKLQYNSAYFADCNRENMLKLVEPFRNIVSTILNEKDEGSGKEADIIKQNALIAIKLLAKELIEEHVDEFKDVLKLLTDILKSHAQISVNMLASLILTITELVVNLKAHALAFLPKFMPILLTLMGKYDNSYADVQLSIAMSVYKIVDTLPLFLSPYLKELTQRLCQLYAKVSAAIETGGDREIVKGNTMIANKLKLLWERLATTIPARIFVPTIEECYQELVEAKQVAAIGVLMQLLSKGFQHFESYEFADYNKEIEKLFLNALQFRCDNSSNADISDEMIDEIEGSIMDAFVSLILKLSEASFKPLYFHIYDWALRESDSKDRAITFYKLSSHVAGALKSLFVLFAPDMIKNAAIYLDDCNLFEGKDANMLCFADQPKKNVVLVENILKMFYQIFLYDNQHFINKVRFDIVMQPIVEQLRNTLILDNRDIEQLLYACVAQLAVAVDDETLWKHLNDQILMKTRNNNKQIRLHALQCCVELAKKIGSGYQVLLPDTVVFLSELLEDDNHEVERSCQKAIQEIEKVVGESLQNYF